MRIELVVLVLVALVFALIVVETSLMVRDYQRRAIRHSSCLQIGAPEWYCDAVAR